MLSASRHHPSHANDHVTPFPRAARHFCSAQLKNLVAALESAFHGKNKPRSSLSRKLHQRCQESSLHSSSLSCCYTTFRRSSTPASVIVIIVGVDLTPPACLICKGQRSESGSPFLAVRNSATAQTSPGVFMHSDLYCCRRLSSIYL